MTVEPFRIDYRSGIRQGLLAFMMIGYDHIDPVFITPVHFHEGRYARVHRYDQRGILRLDGIQSRQVHPISFFCPARYVIVRVRALFPQKTDQYGGGRDTVNVIIPKYRYFFMQ
ncbi:hypothetical protein SDC9_184175 [bioreactor metagenome]|uniref:Uncharacterized protein n=1 Tax=bioreactor metagenome TaxID=1076179 RepID=A0A645HCA9_9ZZZZ